MCTRLCTFLQRDIYTCTYLSNGEGFTIAFGQDQELQGRGVVTHLLKKTDRRERPMLESIAVDKAPLQIHMYHSGTAHCSILNSPSAYTAVCIPILEHYLQTNFAAYALCWALLSSHITTANNHCIQAGRMRHSDLRVLDKSALLEVLSYYMLDRFSC